MRRNAATTWLGLHDDPESPTPPREGPDWVITGVLAVLVLGVALTNPIWVAAICAALVAPTIAIEWRGEVAAKRLRQRRRGLSALATIPGTVVTIYALARHDEIDRVSDVVFVVGLAVALVAVWNAMEWLYRRYA